MNIDERPDYFIDSTGSTPESSATQGKNDDGTIDFTGDASASQEEVPAPKPRKRHRMRRVLIITVLIGLIILGCAFWIRYCNPYVVDSQMTGYVVSVEKRGILFKTWEVDLVSETALQDSARIYTREYSMSVAPGVDISALRGAAAQHTPLTVTYERFYGTLPWRGASRDVITAVGQ